MASKDQPIVEVEKNLQSAGLDGAGTGGGWRTTARQIFGLDLRSLAAFRIGLGLVLLADLAYRATDLAAFYTDVGVLPREVLLGTYNPPYRFSFHFAFGEVLPIGAMFLLEAIIAVLLLVGFRTRLMTVLSWVLLVSLQNRNPIILNGGDNLLALLLFWGMFLPLGARWSLDSLHRDHRGDSRPYLSMATIALLTQICLVYLFAVLHKSGEVWWNGQALFFALHVDLFARRLGIWLRELQWPLPVLTWASLYWEMLGTVLLFIPWKNSFFRTVAVFGFIALHLGIAVTMEVGLFSPISIVAWLAFLPGDFWGWLSRRFRPGSRAEGGIAERVRAIWDRVENRWPILARPCPSPPRNSTIVNLLIAGLLLYVITWNIRTLDPERFGKYVPAAVDSVGFALRLDQAWDMFAPQPTIDDGWFVIEGELMNGEIVDLFRDGAPLTLDKPEYVLKWIRNRRWGKYLMRLKTPPYSGHLKHYAKYLTETWNRDHEAERRMKNLRIFFMREETTPDGPAFPSLIVLWEPLMS